MDRKEKLLLADKLHKENQREEALTILYELIADNEDDHFAWWGIANVSDDLPERLMAVGRVMQLAPSFQKAYALREELEALVPLDDPVLDDNIDMFDLDDDGDDTVLLADEDEDAFAAFQAQLAQYANRADDPDPAATIDAVDSAFDDLDFDPPLVELSEEELEGIEAMGFNAALDAILDGQDLPDLAPAEDTRFGPDDDLPLAATSDYDDFGRDDFEVDDPTNTLPDLSDIVGHISEFVEDTDWMQEFAPRTLGSQLNEDVTGWEEFFPADPSSNVFDEATPDFDDLLALDPMAAADNDSELGDLLDDISLDPVSTPDDTISFYGEAEIDRDKLAAAAAAMQSRGIEADDLEQPDFDTLGLELTALEIDALEIDALEIDALEIDEEPAPHISEVDTDKIEPAAPDFDPLATALDWRADAPTPNDAPVQDVEPTLTSVEGEALNPQEDLMDREIEQIARLDAALEDELSAMQDALSMLEEMDAQLDLIAQMGNIADEVEEAVDTALAEDLSYAEAQLDAALNFGDDPYPFDGLRGDALDEAVRQATDAVFDEDDHVYIEDDTLDRWALEADLDTVAFEEQQANASAPPAEYETPTEYETLAQADLEQLNVVLDADEQAALLEDWNIDLNAPHAPYKTTSEPIDLTAHAPDTMADQPSHVVHEEDLIVRVSSGYESPSFARLPRPDNDEFDMNEAQPHEGEIVSEPRRSDMVVVPDPLHPTSPLNHFVQKNKAVIGVAIGVMAVRVAWRLFTGNRR